MTDSGQLTHLIYNLQPDEIYHLAAQSHVRVSFEMPEFTGDITGMGTTRILEAVRRSGIRTRFYQASSSEMFGDSPSPQKEETPFRPRSPYAAAKVYAYWMARTYREGYGLFGQRYPLQPRIPEGETFVPEDHLPWQNQIWSPGKALPGKSGASGTGVAGDYVEAMWKMLQVEKPDDYVIATGETHSVKEFLEESFGYVDLEWRKYVLPDPRYFRPLDVEYLQGDASKARRILNWEPRVKFKELVRMMVDADLQELREVKNCRDVLTRLAAENTQRAKGSRPERVKPLNLV
jgi:GDPmannose 4,6-dehydratase